jgi:hypothetical protein
MKKVIISSLLAFAMPVFANTAVQPLERTALAVPVPANTLTKEHSSVKESPLHSVTSKRMFDYPTQVVRIKGDVTAIAKSCDEVFAKIDEFYSNHITWDKFFYDTILYCSYDPETNNATSFMINSYFDPLDENAVAYLEKYLAHHNGRKLLGSTFTVESAKGLVVSLNIDAGIEDENDPNALMRYQHDNAGHYYSSDYAMRMDLINDIYSRFYSNDPNVILPFVTTWFKTSTMRYERVLGQSNYVEIQPELVFLMDNEPKIFTPNLRLYYSHHCSQYENGRCL